ncbi:hypothetical protein B7C42_08163 [Nocardia cerradoensis]|uniref:Uncharacterized protein n=1 Tax=Nocardia cerradoensis TaxID=85688 RepID=A0A231GT50_9NOCA|nr:hypothetical protein B7C42_08163 [Nocardia cerradoensis]
MLPHRPLCGDHLHNMAGDIRDALLIDHRGGWRGPVDAGGDDSVQEVVAPEHGGGFGAPVAALLGPRPRQVFAGPGLQGRDLREIPHLHRCGLAPELLVEVDGQLAQPCSDGSVATRPVPDQYQGNAVDFADGALVRVRAGTFGEFNAEVGAEVVVESGVVDLADGHVQPVDHRRVQGAPRAIGTAYAVGDQDVGVQIRVAAAGFAVDETCCDDAVDIELPHPVAAGPGEDPVGLQPTECVVDGGIVGAGDALGHLDRGDGPQRGHAFDGRERDVEACDRRGLRARNLGDEPGQLTVIQRGALVVFGEHFRRDVGANPCANFVGNCRSGVDSGSDIVFSERFAAAFAELVVAGIGAIWVAQSCRSLRFFLRGFEAGSLRGLGGDDACGDGFCIGMAALPEQCSHLCFGDFVAG